MISAEQRACIIKRGSADVNSVRHWKRSARTQVALTPVFAGVQPPEEDYEALFKSRTDFPSEAALEQFCEHFGQVFCPNCIEPQITCAPAVAPGFSARRLFVTVGPDPLGNERDQAWCVCHGCGFEEYHAIELPPAAEAVHPGSIMGYSGMQQMAQQQRIQMQQYQSAVNQQSAMLSNMLGGQGAGSNQPTKPPTELAKLSAYDLARKYLRIL